MALFLLIMGSCMFILGLGYLFHPQLVLRFNAFVRDNFVKDSLVLLSGRRVGVILLLLSFVLLVLTLSFPR